MLIADDHAFTLLGLQERLQSDPRFEVVATARDGISAISLARTHRPAVAVIDFAMPGANGLEALIEISRWAPDTRVAVLTARDDVATLAGLKNAGAAGILSKGEPPEVTLEHVARIAAGETVVSEALLGVIDTGAPSPALTSRETEVLIRVAKGLSNPAIAGELSLSPKTVESHRASLMRKLNVNTTATLLLRAAKDGLIDF